jgi:surface-anchored protein
VGVCNCLCANIAAGFADIVDPVTGHGHTAGWRWDAVGGYRLLDDLLAGGVSSGEWRIEYADEVNSSGQIAASGWKTSTGTYHPLLLNPATRLMRGEVDLGLAWEEDELKFHAHDHSSDIEYEADAVVVRVPALAQSAVPANPAYAFLGLPGAPVSILPQSQNPKPIFLGLAAEEIGAGLFVNNHLELRLLDVEGPGHLAVYAVDGFGQPAVYMNSGDGISQTDRRLLTAGAHEHVNWAFSAPGLYRVKFQAFGTLVAGGVAVQTDPVDVVFEVVAIEMNLEIAQSGNDVSLSFLTQDGLKYQLESAPALTGPWTDDGAAFLGTGRMKYINVPINAGSRFFKMKAATGN